MILCRSVEIRKELIRMIERKDKQEKQQEEAENHKVWLGALIGLIVIVSVFVLIIAWKSRVPGNAETPMPKPETEVRLGTDLTKDGYVLQQVVILSRHNIRSPLSGAGSVLDNATPYTWHEWSSAPSELSVRGGMLETEMGIYFRKWLEDEALVEENYHPASEEVRIYANSKQRTIATARFFSAGLFPVDNISVETHMEFDTMDPVFTPQLTFISDMYAADAEHEIRELFSGRIAGLSDNYELLSDVLDIPESEGWKSGEISEFRTDDLQVVLEEGKEPAIKGSLKTACSISDALVLQYYEEEDPVAAAFGNELTWEDWEAIAEVKDVYEDVLFTAPLIAVNVAHPLLEEIYSEMNTDGRKITFLCGHDSNVGSVLAALNVLDYDLPNAIEKRTPIGCKLVFSKWMNDAGETYWSVDLVYQTTEQLRNISILDSENEPEVYHLEFRDIVPNTDGLYREEDFMRMIEKAIDEYDRIYEEYMLKAAA